MQQCADNKQIKHIILICTAVNFIDASALETLENLIINLRDEGVTLHLAEVKGPVMDQLNSTHFLTQLTPGNIYFTTDQAMREVAGV